MHPNKNSKQVEKELQWLLEKYKLESKLTVKQIKKWVFEAEGQSGMEAVNKFNKKILQYFKDAKDLDELNEILQVVMDAWNYFPHRILDGKSPNQLVQERIKDSPQEDLRPPGEMPKMIIGGREMEWDDYWEMIKEMERVQEPFKNWVEEELLPKYEKYLTQAYSRKTADKHHEVADIFFSRAMSLGFVEFEEIAPGFIQDEFPRWWQTHVIMSSLSEGEVLSSLKKLFQFLAAVYDVDIKEFGF